MTEIEIQIDDRTLKAKPHQTVIEVADEAGIYIPRFCYHKHLTIAANCRMCLVEVEKSNKPLPACATPVSAGMKVYTKSKNAIAAQRSVMEFLLINHPLDCPICDQGGECELQDLAMGYGRDHSEYEEAKRAVGELALGPLIATEMTRCIHCTRCVRFGNEIAGVSELGATYRGEHMTISTYIQHAMQSEVSGNIIDLCPVGALTSQPYRFTARPWELVQTHSISPHDCIGTHIQIHTRKAKVMRVAAREHPEINQTWIADRDRFSYTALNHPDRLKEPLARINGQLQTVDWETALNIAADNLKKVIQENGSDTLGALSSPSATLEEMYLLQKIMRHLGTPHIDCRLREIDTTDQHKMLSFPGLSFDLNELQQCDTLVLIGSNIRKEQPVAALRVRQAALKGAQVIAINTTDTAYHFPLTAKKIVAPHKLLASLQEIALSLQAGEQDDNEVVSPSKKAKQEGNEILSSSKEREQDSNPILSSLRGAKRRSNPAEQNHPPKIAILVGTQVLHHPEASELRNTIYIIANTLNAKVGLLTDGANTAGGWLSGMIPHRDASGKPCQQIGLNAYQIMQQPRQAYVLLNIDPEFDCANPSLATRALQKAKAVIALSLYHNDVLAECASVIFPIAAFTETAGTYINAWGMQQTVQGVAKPIGTARPAWKVLRVFANTLQIPGFEYESTDEIRAEWQTLAKETHTSYQVEALRKNEINVQQFSRIGIYPIYAIDSIVRHSKALQAAQVLMAEPDQAIIRLHPQTAQQLHLQTGDQASVVQAGGTACIFPVIIDSTIAIDAVYIPAGLPETAGLGDLLGHIEIKKA